MVDRLEALERLARLRDGGILTPAEFEAEKARIIAGSYGARDEPADTLATPAATPSGERNPPVTDESRNRRLVIFGGAAAALVVGALLAYLVWGDIRTVRDGAVDRPQRAAVASASPSSVDLSSALRFQNAEDCTPSEGLRSLIESLAAAGSSANPAADASIRVAGYEEPLVPIVSAAPAGGGAPVIVEVDIRGSWNGLHVTRLHSATWGPDAISTVQIHFSEGPGEVRNVLLQLGFPVGGVGELKTSEGAMMGVEAVPGGSALTCARDERDSKASPAGEDKEV